jgi:hypothetical protein
MSNWRTPRPTDSPDVATLRAKLAADPCAQDWLSKLAKATGRTVEDVIQQHGQGSTETGLVTVNRSRRGWRR